MTFHRRFRTVAGIAAVAVATESRWRNPTARTAILMAEVKWRSAS
jgi:hypothetical protein